MKNKLKSLLALVLVAFTSLTWATTYSPMPQYTITSTTNVVITSPVEMPDPAVDNFTVTITYQTGNQRSNISQVELVDPKTTLRVAVDTHEGFSGGSKENHVYTLSNIPAEYAGKVLLVKSMVRCDGAGTSTCTIDLSNGVTHTTDVYTDITEVIAINFGSNEENGSLDTSAEGDLGFVTADGVQGAQVPLAKWNNVSGASGTTNVAGAKTEASYSLTYSSQNTYHSTAENTYNTSIGNLTKGYLDVSNSGGSVPEISLSDMPTTGYDVAVILSGDGETFGAVTVNGKDYIGSDGKTILGEASWGVRQSYDTLAEGQNVIFVKEQSAESLTIVGKRTTNTARASIAGLMVFFREIPDAQDCTFTVTEEGGTWDVTPSTAKPCVATIAFDETTGKSVDLAAILGNVKSLRSLIITGTNGGTITNTDGISAGSIEINTNVTIPSSLATPAVTTIAEGVSVYFTGETTASAASFPYSGNRHFETIKFTVQQMGSGIENYTIAANEQMLFTHTNVRYMENLILDGGLLKTEGNGQAWFGGAANKCLTVKSGIADLTSVTTDNGSSAVLIGYSGNGHTLDIQGGLLDASNTSIVGWEQNSKYRQSGGLVKTKGFRQHSTNSNFTEMTLTGGTIELGAGGIPDLGMASATLGAATIRATADATIAEALNVTGAATLQAVDGKTLTVSGTISGDGTIAIGGTAITKTRADDGSYSDAEVNATGTVYIGTNRPKIESIAEGATLQIALTDDETANGISWEVGENLTTEEANRLTVVGATLGNITVTDGVLTASLASNLAASWENGVWSQTPVDGAPITITFSEGYTTCTFTNTEAIELASLTIKGETAGEIVLGEYAVTVSEMTVEPAEVTIPVALFNSFDAQAYTVESGKTLKLKGDADVSKTMTVTGTGVIDGSMNFTAGNYVNNGGKLEVASGVTLFNTGDGRGFKNGCTVKIANGATLKNGKADAPGYGNVTFDIAGTLEVTGGVRWSLGSTSSTTLHEGAVLKGTGENDSHSYAFDYFDGATITVDGDATIEGNIGAHNAQSKVITLNVAEGKTLTIAGSVKAGTIAASGAGTLTLTANNTYTGGTVIAEGATVSVSNHNTIFGTGNVTGAGTVKIAGGTYNGLSLAQYTDANTTIEIPADSTVTGYFNEATWTCAAKIRLNGTLQLNNGYTGCKYTFTGPWTGAGAISLSHTPEDAIRITGDISDFTGNISIAGARALTFCAATTGNNQKYAGKICVHGDYAYTAKVNGTWSAPVVVENGAKIGGEGSIANTLTFNAGSIIDGSVAATGDVTLNGTVTVSGEAGATVLTCANAESLDLTKFAAPEGLKCVAENGAVKLAVDVVVVTPGESLTGLTEAEANAVVMQVTAPEGVAQETYAGYFTKTVTLEEDGTYTVSAVLDAAVVTPTIAGTTEGDTAKEAFVVNADGSVALNIANRKAGLHYAVQVKSAIDGDVYAVVPETDDGTLAVSAEKIPGGGTAFFRVIVDFQTIDAVEPADAE